MSRLIHNNETVNGKLSTLYKIILFYKVSLGVAGNPGGIRKLRFASRGKGKRGGVRIIYYWKTAAGQIYLLHIYPKNQKDTLTDAEMAVLSDLAREIRHG